MTSKNIKFSDQDDSEKLEREAPGKSKRAPKELSQEVDDSLGLQVITIRLQKTLIEDLKELARKEGLGYQPLMRQILTKAVAARKETAGAR